MAREIQRELSLQGRKERRESKQETERGRQETSSRETEREEARIAADRSRGHQPLLLQAMAHTMPTPMRIGMAGT